MGHPYAGKPRPAGYATTPGSILTGPEPFRQLSKSSASGHLKGTVYAFFFVAHFCARRWLAPMRLLLVHLLAAAAAAAAAAVRTAVPTAEPPCLDLAQKYCHDPALSCPFADATWVALQSGPGAAQWRCYSPSALNANHTAYRAGKDFCTRNTQILDILKTCKLPPPPPPRIQSNATEVFVPGEGGYPCIRIPSIILSGHYLNAFAECRRETGDGCEPLHPVKPSAGAVRDICQKQSTNGGSTWGPLRVIAEGPAAQGTPVYDEISKLLILQWVQLSKPQQDTRQMTSSDNGKTWGKWRSVCGAGSLDKSACGGDVGPGTGAESAAGFCAVF
jgi:hypothetical protein